jgi:acyl carrier protein
MTSTVTDRVIGKIETQGVTPASRIDSLGLDSLDFLQLVVDLDQEFDIKIDIEKVALCETVGDLIALIELQC